MSDLLLGIDSGTSVVKSVLFDLDGHEVAVARREMPIISPFEGASEVDMGAVWALTAETIRQVMQAAAGRNVAAVGISGTACGFWGVDASGQPVRNAILWNDARASDVLMQWRADGTLTTVFQRTGNSLFPGYPLPILRWLQDNEPAVLARTRWLLFHKDWLSWHLTGTFQTDVSDISYFPGDLPACDYPHDLLALVGLAHLSNRLPPILESSAVIGLVTAAASQETNLPIGTPVVAGAVDVVASLLGGGTYRVGQASTVLGTSMLNTLIVDQTSLDPPDTGVQAIIPQQRYARSLVNTSGTLCMDWMIEHLAPEDVQQHVKAGDYQPLEAIAASAPHGSKGLIFLPYLNPAGIVTPFAEPSARGMFFGLSSEHTRAELIRAVYEGVALAMRDCYAVTGQPLTEITLVGGGARSAFWSQLFADVTGKHIHVPEGSEFGARGVALLAGVGAGVYPSLDDAVRRAVHSGHVYEPQPNVTALYDAIYPLYRHLSRSARESWLLRRDILKEISHG